MAAKTMNWRGTRIQAASSPCGWMCPACRCIFLRTKRQTNRQNCPLFFDAKRGNRDADAVLQALAGLNALRQQAPRRLQRLWRIYIMDATGIVHRQRKGRVRLQYSACPLVAGQGH